MEENLCEFNATEKSIFDNESSDNENENCEEVQQNVSTNNIKIGLTAHNTKIGALYELVQQRRQKISGFCQKDLAQIASPDMRPFMNANHAYESLLPYHIFYPHLYEDLMFLNTHNDHDIKGNIKEAIESLKGIHEIYSKPIQEQHGIAAELLLFHEKRYLKNKKKDKVEPKTNRPKPSLKKKGSLNKRNTVLRLKLDEPINLCDNLDIRGGKFIFKKV